MAKRPALLTHYHCLQAAGAGIPFAGGPLRQGLHCRPRVVRQHVLPDDGVPVQTDVGIYRPRCHPLPSGDGLRAWVGALSHVVSLDAGGATTGSRVGGGADGARLTVGGGRTGRAGNALVVGGAMLHKDVLAEGLALAVYHLRKGNC